MDDLVIKYNAQEWKEKLKMVRNKCASLENFIDLMHMSMVELQQVWNDYTNELGESSGSYRLLSIFNTSIKEKINELLFYYSVQIPNVIDYIITALEIKNKSQLVPFKPIAYTPEADFRPKIKTVEIFKTDTIMFSSIQVDTIKAHVNQSFDLFKLSLNDFEVDILPGFKGSISVIDDEIETIIEITKEAKNLVEEFRRQIISAFDNVLQEYGNLGTMGENAMRSNT